MSTKEVVYALTDDKQEIQKQLGCMNGIFQLFDRRYLLGQRRHSHNQKRLPSGQSGNGENKFSNTSEQAKVKTPKKVTKEKQRVSTESARNSFSSSSSSTVFSSLDCSKRLQTDQSCSSQSVISEPPSLSPSLHQKKPDLFIQSPDIRDVVKESMTREPRVVSIKTTSKDEKAGPPMKHIDSPRPFPNQKPVQNDGIDRHLAKLREIQWGVKEVKERSRFSCDERESRYVSKNNMRVKELPRLSLDSRQSYIRNSVNDSSNKRSSSSVVARLMGLEALTVSVDESLTSKKNEESVSNSRLFGKDEELKRDSTRVRKDIGSPQRGGTPVISRIPLETAPWKQEGSGRVAQKPPFKNTSIYGEIEKRLTEHEYKTSGKDLRALKQILEAMQKTKSRLENNEDASENSSGDQKVDRPVSPTIKGINHSLQKTRHVDNRQNSVSKQRSKDSIGRDRRARGRSLSASNFPECSGSMSPRMQRSKNSVVVDKSSPDSSRNRRQPNMQRNLLGSPTRNLKMKSIDTMQGRVQTRGYNGHTRNLSQLSDTVSFQSESNDSEVMSSEWMQEVNSVFRPKENHKSNIAERFTQEKSTADQGKHTVEQPSPVSVLDAFYAEDMPSPVKKKSNAFNDDENLHFEETQDHAPMNNSTLDHYSAFNNVKLENIKTLVHQIELLNTNTEEATLCDNETEDHKYIMEILLASGFLQDLDHTFHLNGNLINPQLFHVLEKTKGSTELVDHGYQRKNSRSISNEKIRRKLVFDTVSDVLGHKLATLSPFGPRRRILNGDKLMKELCSGIDSLQKNSEKSIYDEDDEVLNIIYADVNKRSQDWDEYCYDVSGLVLDIERLIFKDLISEVVNAEVSSLRDWPTRHHRRQLFAM